MGELYSFLARPIELPADSDDFIGESYEDFDQVYSTETLEYIHSAATQMIEQLGIDPQNVLVAGFDQIETGEVDDAKTWRSEIYPDNGGVREDFAFTMGYHDRDSHGLVIDDIDALRSELRAIAQEAGKSWGAMTDSERAKVTTEIEQRKTTIKEMQAKLQHPNTPLYYFTALRGLLNTDAENNPLAYAGFTNETSGIAIYDRQALEADGINIEQFEAHQIRAGIWGEDLKKYRAARILLRFQEVTS